MGLNIAELSKYIRFQLSLLGSDNGHHTFEHIARHLARARICSNIMPATGPVSAGGDGGRDFETYPVVDGLQLPDNTFYALACNEGNVAFACSLQKSMAGKIRSDLKVIKKAGIFSAVVVFCVSEISVGMRQKLQVEALGLELTLQIYDGAAISEMLCDRDLFWVAQHYLHVPADSMPQYEDLPEDYEKLRLHWRERTPQVFNFSDFVDLKIGVRRATFHEFARPDLLMWIKKLNCYLVGQAPRELKRLATYEVVVATFRGLGTFDGMADLVDDYYSDFKDYRSAGHLEDAVNLANYLIGAIGMNLCPRTPAWWIGISESIDDCLNHELKNATGPGRRAELLKICGLLSVHRGHMDGGTGFERSCTLWAQMLKEVEQTPLFPIESFGRTFEKLCDVLSNPVELMRLASDIDDLIASRSGGRESGMKAERRGDIYSEKGDVMMAITEYMRAKKGLFTGDSKFDLLRVALKLSSCLRALGMAYIAKHYALGVAWYAKSHDDAQFRRLLPSALSEVAENECSAGNYLAFSRFTFLALGTSFVHDKFDGKWPEKLRDNLSKLCVMLALLGRKRPEALVAFEHEFSYWEKNGLADPLTNCAMPGFLEEDAIPGFEKSMRESLLDRPWGDVVGSREVRWTAFGLDLKCIFDNRYKETAPVEGFIAFFQSVLVSIAIQREDLIIVPARVALRCTVSTKAKKFQLHQFVFSNGEWAAELEIPASHSDLHKYAVDTLQLCLTILRKFSLLNDRDYVKAVERFSEDALILGNFLRPYGEVYGEFIDAHAFEEKSRSLSEPPFEYLGVSECFDPILPIPGLAPKYNRASLLDRITDRYAAAIPNLRYTALNISKDKEASEAFRALRDEGMKDWYLLCLLSGMATSVRVPEMSDRKPPKDLHDQMVKAARMVETPASALAVTDFNFTHLRIHERAFLPLLLSSLDLKVDVDLISEPGLLPLVKSRFNLHIEDVEHEKIFYWDA